MVENPTCQCKRQGDVGADPWDGKIPGGGDANPVLPGESHGQRSLVGYSPRGHTESDAAEHTPSPPVHLCSITSEEGILHAFLLSTERSYRAGRGGRPSAGTAHTERPRRVMWGPGAGEAWDREESGLEGIL